MEFKYRIKGLIQKPFILRGAYMTIGENMDFYIRENELEFVKDRCKIEELIDLSEQKVNTPEPVLEENKTESETKPKGVNNGVQKPRTNSSNKNKYKNNA